MNPPKFHGDLDPLKTHDCLTSIERIFEVAHFSEEDKVVCATQMLKGPAAWLRMSVSNTMMTTLGISKYWEYFKATMLDKYFLDSMRARKELKFQKLRQGSMIVVKLTTKFKDMEV